MLISKNDNEYVSYIVEQMQIIGPVTAKGMFGGYGIFLKGLMFGLVADSILYLKVDKECEKEFKERGLESFKYYKKGKEVSLSYYQAPEEVLEDSDEMNFWANKAYAAALRVLSKKRKNPIFYANFAENS